MTQLSTSTPTRRVVTTKELQELLAQGKKVVLPATELKPEHEHLYDESIRERARVERGIVSVRHIGSEPVQCITIDDPRHLYVTDDLMATHNTSNIIFLKSTDDSMIETLSKMSGTTHRVYRDSKTVTRDVEKLFLQVEGKVSYTSTAKEEAVISYNDLAYLPERNSIVFRAGDQPIWNRNETVLPMSWRLFKKTIEHYGHPDYTLQTIPTLSTAIDFDVRQNQPDFSKMLETRLEQAEMVERAADTYAKAHNFSAFDIERLDPDVYADEVLDIVGMLTGNSKLIQKDADEVDDDDRFGTHDPSDDDDDNYSPPNMAPDMNTEADIRREQKAREMEAHTTKNTELDDVKKDIDVNREGGDVRRYAGGKLSRNMLHDIGSGGAVMTSFDADLIIAFLQCKGALSNDERFIVTPKNELYGRDNTPYITLNSDVARARKEHRDDVDTLNDAAQDEDTRIYAEGDIPSDAGSDPLSIAESNTYKVHVEFKKFLISFDDWKDIAEGSWDAEVRRAIDLRVHASGNHM